MSKIKFKLLGLLIKLLCPNAGKTVTVGHVSNEDILTPLGVEKLREKYQFQTIIVEHVPGLPKTTSGIAYDLVVFDEISDYKPEQENE